MTDIVSTDVSSQRARRPASLPALLVVLTLLALVAACERTAPTPQAAASLNHADAGQPAHVAGGPLSARASAPIAPDAGPVPRFAAADRGERVELPAAIARGLQTDERVLECATGTRDGVSQFEPGWVGVRRIDLDGDGREDWIVNGRHACLTVDGTPAWWVYIDHADGMRLVLAAQPAVALQVLRTRSDGMRNLSAERADGHAVTLQAERGSYVPRPDRGAPSVVPSPSPR